MRFSFITNLRTGYANPNEAFFQIRLRQNNIASVIFADSGNTFTIDDFYFDPAPGEFEINVTTFIPGNFVPGPPQSFCVTMPSVDFTTRPPTITPPHVHALVFSGDNRGADPEATSYRTRQFVTVIPDSTADADGLKDGSIQNLVGATKAYADDALANGTIDAADNDGVLGDCHLLHATATASASNMHVTVARTSDSVVSVHLFGGASNPLVSGAPAIDWDFTITIDTSGSSPQWTLQGTWDGFPAVEIYINNELIYLNSAGPGPYSFGSDLIKLFPGIGDVTVNQSGTISSALQSLAPSFFLAGAFEKNFAPGGPATSAGANGMSQVVARLFSPPTALGPVKPNKVEESLPRNQTGEHRLNDLIFESWDEVFFLGDTLLSIQDGIR